MKLIIIIHLILSSFIFSQNLWEHTSFPDSISILSLAIDNDTHTIYAGTNTYGVFKSSDKGNTWIEINNGISGSKIIRDILIINNRLIFIASENGLFKTTNQGDVWQHIIVGAWDDALGYLTFSPKGDIFAGTWDGIYVTTDQGNTWKKIFYSAGLVEAICFDSKSNIYTGYAPLIYKSFDYGLTWQFLLQLETGPYVHSLHSSIVSNNDNILLGTYDGGIFSSSDYGSTFNPHNYGLDYNGIADLLVDEGNHISAITFPKGFYNSTNDGNSWNSYSSGLNNDEPTKLAQDSSGYFYLGSYSGGIYKSKFSFFMFLPKRRNVNFYTQPHTIIMDSVLVKNRSDSVLVVSNISCTNSNFQLAAQNFTINPGGMKYFTYSYNPIQKGIDTGLISFHNNSIIDNEGIMLKGYSGIPVLQVPFYTISFNYESGELIKDTIMLIRNIGIDTLFIDSIKTNNPTFFVNYCRNFILPKDSLLLKISFNPTSLTYYKGYLILYSNNFSSPDSVLVSGYGSGSVGILDKGKNRLEYQLFQNYPNPFNPTTTIKYQISKPGIVTLVIYDILGREVATLVRENKIQGNYNLTFDATKLVSGVYIYQLRTNDMIISKKMILIK